MTHFHFRPDSC
ncbi:hypothetical protein YPPY113_3007, partial [Yersinia pestis PY-113]